MSSTTLTRPGPVTARTVRLIRSPRWRHRRGLRHGIAEPLSLRPAPAPGQPLLYANNLVHAVHHRHPAAITRIRGGHDQVRVNQADLVAVERQPTHNLQKHPPGHVVDRINPRKVQSHPGLRIPGAHGLPDNPLRPRESDTALQLKYTHRTRPTPTTRPARRTARAAAGTPITCRPISEENRSNSDTPRTLFP